MDIHEQLSVRRQDTAPEPLGDHQISDERDLYAQDLLEARGMATLHRRMAEWVQAVTRGHWTVHPDSGEVVRPRELAVGRAA